MDLFTIKVLLSLIVGIIFVVGSTYVAERVSGKLGGLIVGLPSTAVISLLFVGLTQGVSAALISSQIIPYSSGLYTFFFITYLWLSKKGFILALIGSLAVWFFFAYFASIFAPNTLLESSLIGFTLIISSLLLVVKKIHINQNVIPKKIVSSPVWIKALLTGIVIGFIVLISKIAGAKWGGIFATFPALTISTILITVKSGGVEFTRLIAKNVLISTTTTISLFAILCYYLYPIFGVIKGTLLSYLGLLMISIPIYFYIFEKIKE